MKESPPTNGEIALVDDADFERVSQPRSKSSRFRGVSFCVRLNAFEAKVGVNYKTVFLGSFKDEEVAARAYDMAALFYFGEFARPNFADSVAKEPVPKKLGRPRNTAQRLPDIKPRNIRPVEIGQRYGLWTVLGFSHKGQRSKKFYLCQCDCGTRKVVLASSLNCGVSASCGCLRRGITGNRFLRHGLTQTSGYSSWAAMRRRCYSPADASFSHYGGRGITVCERWRESYENFLADMGTRPSPKHSIDRINNEGNYEPSNCRWATVKEQANNRRTSHFLTFKGKTQTATQWEEELGLSKGLAFSRLSAGWTPEYALTPRIPDVPLLQCDTLPTEQIERINRIVDICFPEYLPADIRDEARSAFICDLLAGVVKEESLTRTDIRRYISAAYPTVTKKRFISLESPNYLGLPFGDSLEG